MAPHQSMAEQRLAHFLAATVSLCAKLPTSNFCGKREEKPRGVNDA